MKIKRSVIEGAKSELRSRIKTCGGPYPQVPSMASGSAYEDRVLDNFMEKVQKTNLQQWVDMMAQAEHVVTLMSIALEDGVEE